MTYHPILIALSSLLWPSSLLLQLAIAGGSEGERFLVRRGGKLQLVSQLEARDKQAGERTSGRKWIVFEDGCWKTNKYELRDGKEIEEDGTVRSGTLDEAKLTSLAAGLERHGLDRLPAHLGRKPTEGEYDPGAYSYHIRFGEKTIDAYSLRPRRGNRDIRKVILGSIPKGGDQRVWEEFAALAYLIEEACRTAKAD